MRRLRVKYEPQQLRLGKRLIVYSRSQTLFGNAWLEAPLYDSLKQFIARRADFSPPRFKFIVGTSLSLNF